MSYSGTIGFLYSLQKHGIKLGLERIKKILNTLGNPEQKFRSIHIAGTNGKGSAAAACECMLRQHGCNTGLFTSPHLVSFTERIRINGNEITEADVIRLAGHLRNEIKEVCEQYGEPTFFEFVTAMAFYYFADKNINWAVVETGMGGRLDATNVLLPNVSVIMPISFDHKEFLGNTIEEIAVEKAGIIKQGVPVVSASQKHEAADVLMTTAKEMGSKIYFYGNDFTATNISASASGSTFDYTDSASSTTNIQLPLAGEYQPANASVAIKAVSLALDRHKEFDAEKTRVGLSRLRWQGRLEMISGNPPFLIDAAHNPDAAEALAAFLKKWHASRKIILVIGIMADKDINKILKPLLEVAAKTIFTKPSNERAASSRQLGLAAADMGYKDTAATDNIAEAIDLAHRISAELSVTDEPAPLIVATGSFYTTGEIKAALGAKRTLH
ncbi:MAG: bifunctional folylpolyglutamate synthase/dihydrofolate synthase, partial [Nitrospiraceae bacterium]|nr:bifunctional folylpolyglutamate synthase/dihydrofolate synthase [Nitrospiraceae bacterium]